jgi:hypothetical protein
MACTSGCCGAPDDFARRGVAHVLERNQALETGGALGAGKVRVESDVQFVRQGD